MLIGTIGVPTILLVTRTALLLTGCGDIGVSLTGIDGTILLLTGTIGLLTTIVSSKVLLKPTTVPRIKSELEAD